MDGLFISYAFENFPMFLLQAALMMFSICLHEFCHALVAKLCGDSTAEEMGYLTLNPLRVMGINSLLMLLFFGIAWGAVPVNHGNLRTRWRRIAVDVAGVSANIMLGVLFALITVAVAYFIEDSETLAWVIFIASALNFTMALFNMLPVPPLDGYNVWSELIPQLRSFGSTEFQRGAMLLIMVMMFMFGFKILFNIGMFLSDSIFQTIALVLS